MTDRLKRRRQTPSATYVGGTTDMEKTQILQSGNYGYAHVWELQQLRGTVPETSTPGEQRSASRVLSPCPIEFGSHLGKPPGFTSPRDHPYESPRISAPGHCQSTRRNVDVNSGVISPNCHEFDLHIKTTVGTGSANVTQDNMNEARYTD